MAEESVSEGSDISTLFPQLMHTDEQVISCTEDGVDTNQLRTLPTCRFYILMSTPPSIPL